MEWNKEKRYTDRGIPIIAVILAVVVVFAGLTWLEYIDSVQSYGLIAILLFGLLCFYNITITIENTHISFILGIGLIKKRYEIKNIKSCKPIISQKIGIGAKIDFNGKIIKRYIVTGFKAIELQFHDSKTIVHIGTTQPDEICKQIQSLIDGNKITDCLKE